MSGLQRPDVAALRAEANTWLRGAIGGTQAVKMAELIGRLIDALEVERAFCTELAHALIDERSRTGETRPMEEQLAELRTRIQQLEVVAWPHASELIPTGKVPDNIPVQGL